ncbi:MAG: hypothetical protein HDT28_03055 [Clostridiales bacterium]|nr:hypothetical protein [Clostridiales bacterium]
MKDNQEKKEPEKKPSVFKKIFVHNIGWKLFALGAAIVIWVLSAGLL